LVLPPRGSYGSAVAFHIADLFESVAPRVADRAAIVWGDTTMTYGELDRRANNFAHYLIAQGTAPNEAVGLLMHNEPDYLVLLLGCYKARAVPINLDPYAHLDELVHVVQITNAALVVHAPSETHIAADLARTVPGVSYKSSTEVLADAHIDQSRRPPVAERSGDDHYILFTGGSTGIPWGVVWRHEDVFFAALGGGNWSGPSVTTPDQVADNILRSCTHVFLCSPLRHASAQWVALSALLSGATLVLSRQRGFDAETVLDEIDQHSVTLLSIIGDAFARPLIDQLRASQGRWDLSTVNGVFSGGAVLSKCVGAALLEFMPTAVIVDSYGSTETGGQGRWVTAAGADTVQEGSEPPRFVMDPSTAVLNQNLEAIAPGSGRIGRIARSGRVPIGFLTPGHITPDVLFERDGVRWVLSHDLGRVAESGAIEFLGRENASLKSGGRLVHAEEVEVAVSGHESVYDVVVTGTPDEVLGQRVTAIVQRKEGESLSDDELSVHCRELLANYKIPRTIIWVDKVERNHLGKLDRTWAKQLVGAPLHSQS
jgi:3-oxocholest-4-en-26-oate---CoA ligase